MGRQTKMTQARRRNQTQSYKNIDTPPNSRINKANSEFIDNSNEMPPTE